MMNKQNMPSLYSNILREPIGKKLQEFAGYDNNEAHGLYHVNSAEYRFDMNNLVSSV